MRPKSPLPLRTFRCKAGEFQCRHFLVFCDGAVRPSPYGWAGIGYAVFTDDGRFVVGKGYESKTSRKLGINKAELFAVIRALLDIKDQFGPSGVSVHTDSKFVVRLAKGYAQARRDDVIATYERFRCIRDDHLWVRVTKVDSKHPNLVIPHRYSNEGAVLGKQRAQGRHSGPRWAKEYSGRRFFREYDATKSVEIDDRGPVANLVYRRTPPGSSDSFQPPPGS